MKLNSQDNLSPLGTGLACLSHSARDLYVHTQICMHKFSGKVTHAC